MITVNTDPVRLLRLPPEKQSDESPNSIVEDETKDKSPEKEEYILCRQCHHIITSPAEQVEVQGTHKHTFANPYGIVFEIGCFRIVKGCGHAGPFSDEFSWFKGFSWQITVCIMCLTHLGWFFSSQDSTSFYGLILDRLVFQ